MGVDGMHKHEIPKGYFDAARHPDAPQICAMQREFNQLSHGLRHMGISSAE